MTGAGWLDCAPGRDGARGAKGSLLPLLTCLSLVSGAVEGIKALGVGRDCFSATGCSTFFSATVSLLGGGVGLSPV